MENWKAVVGFEGLYEVSDMGNIRRVGARLRAKGPLPMLIKPVRKGANYAGLCLFDKTGKRIQTYVHILVMRAFCGETPEGKEPNHKNGQKWDNRVENLEFVTHQENCKHRHAYLVSVTRNADGTFKKFTRRV